MTPAASSDLNDAVTFPSFRSLPHENEVEGNYHSLSGSISSPYRHWCFLGTIVDRTAFVRLRLDVKDKKGTLIPVAFHTDDRGRAFAQGCVPGHTLVVLYAQQHDFFDGTTGIRIEEDAFVKVLPYTMEQILGASSFLFSEGRGGRCEYCGKEAKDVTDTLKRCARCKQASYCGKTCQQSDWGKSHKETCRILKQLEWFTEKNWERFDGGSYFEF
ncbi:hypothetical protein BV22DRAFT_1000801 [Leucogyrophana mollusca]|uniref:Uncharacterized protein n=1 Tax=Leucogyrophana mollusca TaxID=85980 RepID=A0ACB8BXP3_9AGAM|nr:hypothetical protein BV22DRAFT_1000801 [Leucogyrophana mollusca]